MAKKLMHLGNARVSAQKKQMEELSKLDICPFCREHFEDHHKAPILLETRYWLLTKNDYPYEGVKVHLLVVYKEHIVSPSQISPLAAKELPQLMKWAERKFKLKGASFIMRFGDMRFTGATIAHLHAHIVSGIRGLKNSEPIKQKIGFKKK